jgi:DNA-binding transcriptional regulator YiaG
MKKTIKQYTFNGFGFPIELRNVGIKKTDLGEEYLDLDLKQLELDIVKKIIKSNRRLSGAMLKFLRVFSQLSLRQLAKELQLPHSTIKLWEDQGEQLSGLSFQQFNKLKFLILTYIHHLEQKELIHAITSSSLGFDDGTESSICINYGVFL